MTDVMLLVVRRRNLMEICMKYETPHRGLQSSAGPAIFDFFFLFGRSGPIPS